MTRAQVLRAVAEDSDFSRREFTRIDASPARYDDGDWLKNG